MNIFNAPSKSLGLLYTRLSGIVGHYVTPASFSEI